MLTPLKNISKTLPSSMHSIRGAIDLASIMVGILVIGIIGGIIAAVVFAVIPWAQDNAAKSKLDSVITAQSAYRGFTAEEGTSKFATDEELSNYRNGLLERDPAVRVWAEEDCFVATSTSATGNIFYVTQSSPKAEPYENVTAAEACGGSETELPPTPGGDEDDSANGATGTSVLDNYAAGYSGVSANGAAYSFFLSGTNFPVSTFTDLNESATAAGYTNTASYPGDETGGMYQFANPAYTTGTAYDKNGQELGTVTFTEPNLQFFHDGTTTTVNLGQAYLNNFSDLEDYYNLHDGGYLVITVGDYNLRLNVAMNDDLNNPADITYAAERFEMYSAWQRDVALDVNNATNNTLRKTFYKPESGLTLQRVADTTATFYYSPTGNNSDYVVDAENVAVQISTNVDLNWVKLLQDYQYAQDFSYYADGEPGSEGKGAWKIVVDFMGKEVVYESSNEAYSWN